MFDLKVSGDVTESRALGDLEVSGCLRKGRAFGDVEVSVDVNERITKSELEVLRDDHEPRATVDGNINDIPDETVKRLGNISSIH